MPTEDLVVEAALGVGTGGASVGATAAIEGGTALLQAMIGASKRNKANAAMPNAVDPSEVLLMDRIRQQGDALRNGTRMNRQLSGINENLATGYNKMFSSGGGIRRSLNMMGKLYGDSITNLNSINSAQSVQYDQMLSKLVTDTATRKFGLGLQRNAQLMSDSATAKGGANKNFMSMLAELSTSPEFANIFKKDEVVPGATPQQGSVGGLLEMLKNYEVLPEMQDTGVTMPTGSYG